MIQGHERDRAYRSGIGLVALGVAVLPVAACLPAEGSAPRVIETATIEIPLPEAPPPDNESGGVIAAELTGDTVMELLVTWPGSVSAVSVDGNHLWRREVDIQVSTQSEEGGLPGWHGPGVQAADIDDDGDLEVLYLTQSGELHVVDGRTGEPLRAIPLAAPDGAERWEHLVVANFRGGGDHDLLLQATNVEGYRMGRYVAAFAFEDLMGADPPEPLWTRDDFPALAHGGARVVDLDGDGRDEVVSAGVVGPDGTLLYELELNGHLDAVQFADVREDLPGLEVVGLEESRMQRNRPPGWFERQIQRFRGGPEETGNRVFLFGPQGLIWATDYYNQEPQNAAIGDFDPDSTGLEIWCRTRYETDQEPFVLDAQGHLASSYALREMAPSDWTDRGLEIIHPIHWTGGPRTQIAAKERHEAGDVAVLDPMTGEFLVRFPGAAAHLYVADVTGDWREEIVILDGGVIRIHVNSDPNPNPSRPSLWSEPHYRRGKQSWNYYST